jgi:hypothetical protein
MTAAHLVRQAGKRRKAAPALPERTYPIGYFTELVRRHNWPPCFVSQIEDRGNHDAQRQAAQQQRQAGAHAWETMPLNMPGAAEHVARWKGSKV